MLLLDLANISYGVFGAHDNGIEDETILVLLDLAHHLGLLVGAAVVMNNANASEESHEDSHVGLRDSVHGRRHQRQFQCDALGDLGVESNLVSRETDVTRQDEEVIVSVGGVRSDGRRGRSSFNSRQASSLLRIQKRLDI